MQKSVFELICSCTLLRNGNVVELGKKGKEKRVRIYAFFDNSSSSVSFSKHPFIQVESFQTQKEDCLFKFSLRQITKINQSLASQGRMTLELQENNVSKSSFLCLTGCKNQDISRIVNCISDLLKQFIDKAKQVNKSSSSEQGNEQIEQQTKQLSNDMSEKKGIEKDQEGMNLSEQKVNESEKPKQKVHFAKEQPAVEKEKVFQFHSEKRIPINDLKITVIREKSKTIIEDEYEMTENQGNNKNDEIISKSFKKIKRRNLLLSETEYKVRRNIDRSTGKKDQIQIIQRSPSTISNPLPVNQTTCSNTSNNNSNQTIPVMQENKQVQYEKQNDVQSISSEQKQITDQLKDSIGNNNNNNNNTQVTIQKSSQSNSDIDEQKSKQISSNNNTNKKIVKNDSTMVSNKSSLQLKDNSINSRQEEEEYHGNNQQEIILLDDNEFIFNQSKPITKKPLKSRKQIKIDQMYWSSEEDHFEKNSTPIEEQTNEIETIQHDESSWKSQFDEEERKMEEEKRRIAEEQLALCDRQLMLHQKEKELKILQAERKYKELEEYSKNLEKKEKIILETRKALEESLLKENDKYFIGKKGDESQYEKEKKLQQLESYKQQEINSAKYSGLQERLMKMKESQNKKNVESIQTKNKVGLKLGLKKRNPFEYNEDESNESNYFSSNRKNNEESSDDSFDDDSQKILEKQIHKQKQLARQKALKILGRVDNSPSIQGDFPLITGIHSITQIKPNNILQAETDMKANRISIKKLGSKYVKIGFVQPTDEEWRKSISSLPSYLLGNILSFFPINERLEWRFLSKDMNKGVQNSIQYLTLKDISIPLVIIKSFLSFQSLKSLIIGRLPQVSSSSMSKIFQCSHLLQFDCSNYISLEEETLLLIAQVAPDLQALSLPYFGRISDNILIKMPDLFKNLNYLHLDSCLDSYHRNEYISDMALAQIITRMSNLTHFKIFTATSFLFQKLKYFCDNSSSNKAQLLSSFKIVNLRISNLTSENEEPLTQIIILRNISTLKIKRILKKDPNKDFLDFCPQMQILSRMFETLSRLEYLHLGKWCTNEALILLSSYSFSLKKLKISSDSFDDNGLSFFLKGQSKLEKINLVGSSQIKGYCFLESASRVLNIIKVSLEEEYLSQLQQIISIHLKLWNCKLLNQKV